MITKDILTISEYVDFVEQYKGEFYFRGQANEEWYIEPNIFRNPSNLELECLKINEDILNGEVNILKKILHLQHYGVGTRLCDITINPLVALYFAVEDDKFDDKDSCVYVFDKTMNIEVDSDQMKVLLLLTSENLPTVADLVGRCKELNLIYDKKEILEIIQKNYIVKYNRDLSWSNNRAFLQGGTGIYFGFKVEDDKIIRKGEIGINSLVAKIIIPKDLKRAIRKYLQEYGLNATVLYDQAEMNTNSLDYIVIEKSITTKPSHNKVMLDIKVSDIIFGEQDINSIASRVFQESKLKYGKNSRIYMYIYYDEQDKRSTNWIARTTPINNFMDFQLNYESRYHIKRMQYINEEISINTIYSKINPIVLECFEELKSISKIANKYFNNEISREEYKELLEQIRSKLHYKVYWDLQDIGHGGKVYDKYYNTSNSFCMNMIAIIEEQILYIDRNENNRLLQYNYEMKKKECDQSYEHYTIALKELKNLGIIE